MNRIWVEYIKAGLKEVSSNYIGLNDALSLDYHRAEKSPHKRLKTYGLLAPYAFMKIASLDKHIVVNRYYKPCGISNFSGWVRYEDYASHHVESNDEAIEFIRENLNPITSLSGETCYFLYSDSTAPSLSKKNYLRYVSTLSSLIRCAGIINDN